MIFTQLETVNILFIVNCLHVLLLILVSQSINEYEYQLDSTKKTPDGAVLACHNSTNVLYRVTFSDEKWRVLSADSLNKSFSVICNRICPAGSVLAD